MSSIRRFAAMTAAAAVVASGLLISAGAGTSAADGSTGQVSKYVPLSSRLRICNFTPANYVPAPTQGTAWAVVTRNGSTVSAEVHTAGVTGDIWYGVRLVQVPRPGFSCGGGDPGVAMGRLYTDGAGIGTTTVSGPLINGATGAWVSLEGPLANSDLMAPDVRTSDFVAHL